MGLEIFLVKFFGDNDAFLMLGAFAILIFMNFATEMYVEIRKNDLTWADVERVGAPILLNAMFLLGLEAVMIPASRVPFAYELFVTVQTAGWLAVMAFYFYGFYQNLKTLGLKSDKRIDAALEQLKERDIAMKELEKQKEEEM